VARVSRVYAQIMTSNIQLAKDVKAEAVRKEVYFISG
jgi:hypothetical protein